ncbi:MAG TPA: hypothetical protein VKV28_03830 [Candidatus Binataceae bacterium]|nr:hypothetical protein [Candidatus Binataceae bacterium]
MNEVEGKRIVAILAAAYPNWRPNEITLQLYERILRPLPAALAERAVLDAIHSAAAFAPPVGALCERVGQLACAEGELDPAQAWGQVQSAIRATGWYKTPRFSSPALRQTVAALGWRELCATSNPETMRAHFLRLFERFQKRLIATRVAQLCTGNDCPRLAAGWSEEEPTQPAVRRDG